MSNILSVPHYPQLHDGYCLPACVQMALAYWGVERPQAAIAKQLQTVDGVGTPASRVQRLSSSKLEITYRSGELADLELALSQGIPPIIFVDTIQLPYWVEATAHAVVLLGIEQNRVFINDPAKTEVPIQTSLGDFHLAWDEMFNLYALLRKI